MSFLRQIARRAISVAYLYVPDPIAVIIPISLMDESAFRLFDIDWSRCIVDRRRWSGIDASASESAADEDTTEESASYTGGNLAAVVPWFRSDRDEGANDEAGRPQLTFSFHSPSASLSGPPPTFAWRKAPPFLSSLLQCIGRIARSILYVAGGIVCGQFDAVFNRTHCQCYWDGNFAKAPYLRASSTAVSNRSGDRSALEFCPLKKVEVRMAERRSSKQLTLHHRL